MKVITTHIPDKYVEAVDQLVREGLYPNRAEAIRAAVRDLLRREYWSWVPQNYPIRRFTPTFTESPSETD